MGSGELLSQVVNVERRAYRRLRRELGALAAPGASADLGRRILEAVAAEAGQVTYFSVESVQGRVFVAHGLGGIRFLLPADDGAQFEQQYAHRFSGAIAADLAPPTALVERVRRALNGDRRALTALRFDLGEMGEFQRAVLARTLEIPRGEVRGYGWVAREIGRPGAARAVGQALNRNPIPLLIPCHRVVGERGSLTGYALGLDRKRALLALEGLDDETLEWTARTGAQYAASRTTKIFCLPSCHQARRIRPENCVPLRDAKEAGRSGYRPCKRCRPAAA